MDFLQTKTKVYVIDDERRCVAQVMAIAEKGGFRIYVAWEWQDCARNGLFGFTKSRELYPVITTEAVDHTKDYGFDIGGTGEEKKVFANMFK